MNITKGFYVLCKTDSPISLGALKKSFVAGASIRATWTKLQPSKIVYNWKYLYDTLEAVDKTGGTAMLRIFTGVGSPEWIYRYSKPFSFRDTNPNHDTYNKTVKTPVPWDVFFLDIWGEFLDRLGEACKGYKDISLIHMAGPTTFSTEFYLANFPDYTKEKLISSWKDCIGRYVINFDSQLALNISIPLKDDGAMEEIVDLGLDLEEQICIQGNWLSQKTTRSFKPYKLIYDLNQKMTSATIGFQTSGTESRSGPLEKSTQIGLNAGAKYFELYGADIMDSANTKFLTSLSEKLK